MLVIRHIRQLITCAGGAPRRGPGQGNLPIVEDGAIVAEGERILFAGQDKDLPASLISAPDPRVIDGRGLSVIPGFVDGHTHAMFAGDRREELRRRLGGATYAEMQATVTADDFIPMARYGRYLLENKLVSVDEIKRLFPAR